MPRINKDDARRIRATVHHFERTARNKLPPVPKKVRLQSEGGGTGECTCPEVHRFVTNGPTAGTFILDYTVNSVTEELEWDWDATAADVETEFETHSEIGSGDVEVTGGPWPFVGLYVQFTGALAATSIDFPVVDNSNLTGGSGFMDKFSKAG